ncbi:hypothetical protein ACIQUG_27245 [Ensifer sp. NPDC090286]|uniref:hypothetical protein n=1 Tax=Ensifer sp. NPDC090286 TaxID=3363991 RepID=UPI003839E158
MTPLLNLHMIAATRGDGLRPELLGAMVRESRWPCRNVEISTVHVALSQHRAAVNTNIDLPGDTPIAPSINR